MKISTAVIKNWLRRTISDYDLIQALEQAGIEVEQFSSPKPIDEKIIVGLVKKVIQHPGADRLKLVFVDTGKREVKVVCGAPNVRTGLKVALAQAGVTLPSGDRIAVAKLRGELSDGMLCSEQELGLGSDHDGILELADSTELGARLCDIYPAAATIDLKTQPNRFDLLSAVGLAREVAAITGNELKPLPQPLAMDSSALTVAPGLLVPAPELDPAASQFILAQLSLAPATTKSAAPPTAANPTPTLASSELTAALQSAGIRTISPIVDITNYVNLELGQPLHAYDAAKVKLPLTARFARAGETLTTLDGVKRQLTPQDLVIADASGPIGLAGVMGGASTQVTATTREILLEAATFDAATVRKTAQRHGLRTEASARFERGLPVQLAPIALTRAIQLLAETVGARLTATQRHLGIWPWIQRIGLRHARLTGLLGFPVTAAEAIATLARLHIDARPFDIATEARAHLGKPYKFGAGFKADGTTAFDCSYLTDYLYSLIGLSIGHTAHQQFQNGQPIGQPGHALQPSDLRPGDLLFRGGPWHQLKAAERGGVSHVALYVGAGRIVHAVDSARDAAGRWAKLPHSTVIEESADTILSDPEFLGARRYADHLADFITVPAVPWWRPDLKEGQDLVEEIIRVLGYDRVPATIPPYRPRRVTFDRQRSPQRLLQRVLYGAGLFEVMTYSFVSRDQLTAVGLNPSDHLKLKNPLSSEQAYLRSSLLPSHLGVLARNRTYAKEFAYYEISRVFVKRDAGQQPAEPQRLAITLLHPADAYRHLKGILDALATELNLDLVVAPFTGQKAATRRYLPGRVASVTQGGHNLGLIGQLNPDLLQPAKITGEVAYLELELDPLIAATRPRTFAGLQRFPAAQRDLAVVLPADATWQAVAAALSQLPATHVTFVSDYHGPDLPAGHKSLALRLTLAHADRTPTDAEAAAVERKAAAILARTFGAVPRS